MKDSMMQKCSLAAKEFEKKSYYGTIVSLSSIHGVNSPYGHLYHSLGVSSDCGVWCTSQTVHRKVDFTVGQFTAGKVSRKQFTSNNSPQDSSPQKKVGQFFVEEIHRKQFINSSLRRILLYLILLIVQSAVNCPW
jgi:hypothetical protein